MFYFGFGQANHVNSEILYNLQRNFFCLENVNFKSLLH